MPATPRSTYSGSDGRLLMAVLGTGTSSGREASTRPRVTLSTRVPGPAGQGLLTPGSPDHCRGTLKGSVTAGRIDGCRFLLAKREGVAPVSVLFDLDARWLALVVEVVFRRPHRCPEGIEFRGVHQRPRLVLEQDVPLVVRERGDVVPEHGRVSCGVVGGDAIDARVKAMQRNPLGVRWNIRDSALR